MARPRSYFERNQYAIARRAAQERGLRMFLFSRPLRNGKMTSGYYVGKNVTTRWKNATFEQKRA